MQKRDRREILNDWFKEARGPHRKMKLSREQAKMLFESMGIKVCRANT